MRRPHWVALADLTMVDTVNARVPLCYPPDGLFRDLPEKVRFSNLSYARWYARWVAKVMNREEESVCPDCHAELLSTEQVRET